MNEFVITYEDKRECKTMHIEASDIRDAVHKALRLAKKGERLIAITDLA
jgi:hypothetical protein|tara:strand:- start:2752 stop:2898 length:147 start_codon:yes stop_codon:yes gene_type:complete